MAIIYSINNKIAVLNNKWMQKAEAAPTPTPTPVDTYRQCYVCSENTLNETTHICSNCGTSFGECPECGEYAVYEQPTGWGHEEWDEDSGEMIYVDDYGNACGACGWHEWEDPDPGDDPGDEGGEETGDDVGEE